MPGSNRYEAARAHVQKLKEFYVHLTAFVLVNAALIAINLLQEPDKLWFHWVLGGWGIGMICHALAVFGEGFASNWEKRKVEAIVRREKQQPRT